MIRRYRFWRAAAAVFALLNLGGAIFAVASGEPMHAAGHVALFLPAVAAYTALRARGSSPQQDTLAAVADERFNSLQQSVDALAVGVERVGEAQRFQAKILDERKKASPPSKPTTGE